MTRFRPCIDLHSGQVKQIVGGTLSNAPADLKTNYVSALPASHYAGLYRTHDLRGGHVVKLGPGNDDAAREALSTWPGGLQVAGGITDENARYWIDQGADKVSIYICIYAYICSVPCWKSKDQGIINVAGYYHFVPLPRRQVLAAPSGSRPCSSGRRQIKAGLGSELSQERRYLVCSHGPVADHH